MNSHTFWKKMFWWAISMWKGAQDHCIDNIKWEWDALHTEQSVFNSFRCWQRCGAVGPHTLLKGRAALWQYLLKLNIKDELSDPATPILVVNPRELGACPPEDLYKHVHSWFDGNFLQRNSSVSTPGRISMVVQLYSTILTATKPEMSLRLGIILHLLSERSQTLMSTYCVHPVIWRSEADPQQWAFEQYLPQDGEVDREGPRRRFLGFWEYFFC